MMEKRGKNKDMEKNEIKNELNNELKKKHLLLELFLSTLYISSFTFGGGFVIVTFMKRKFVDELHWIDEQEMLDLVALAQSSPGAIAVNAAILVGWRVCGFAGMLSRTGDDPAAYDHPVRHLVVLCRVCQQRICGFGVKRNAGRSCRCDPGCDMQSGRQCAEGKKCIQHCHHGSSFCRYILF